MLGPAFLLAAKLVPGDRLLVKGPGVAKAVLVLVLVAHGWSVESWAGGVAVEADGDHFGLLVEGAIQVMLLVSEGIQLS